MIHGRLSWPIFDQWTCGDADPIDVRIRYTSLAVADIVHIECRLTMFPVSETKDLLRLRAVTVTRSIPNVATLENSLPV